MDQGLIPRRYAKAIYQVAAERGDERRLYELMSNAQHAFASQPGLSKTMANPFVSDEDKSQLMMTAAGATPDDKTYADTLRLLAQNRRLDQMRLIAGAYCNIYRRVHHIAQVTVTSAATLPQDVEQRIKSLIATHLHGGTMEYSSQVDPDLIGGFTVQVDNELLDASVKNELKQLRINLIN